MAKTKRFKQTDIGTIPEAGGRVLAAKGGLYDEVRGMIAAARERVAVSVNAELSMLYWRVGQAIRRDVLGHGRADYGQRIVVELACRLSREFGDGWSVKTLRHCLRAAETMTEDQIVSATRRQLSWTHIKSVLYEEHVKLLALDKSNIRVATYMTELPPKDVLEAKFRQAIEFARRQQDEAK